MRPIIAMMAVTALSIVTFVNTAPRDSGRKIDPRILPSNDVDHSVTYSNILPGDYVGPHACAECHQQQFDAWKTHPHSCMNQLPNQQSVKGDFNCELTLPTGKVEFKTEKDEQGKRLYKMYVYKDSDSHPFREYVVTKTVGSRYIQSYIGKQIRGPEPKTHNIYREHKLPFGYWFKIRQWLPEIYFNTHDSETLHEGVAVTKSIDLEPRVVPYTENCMNCHNTLSYAYRIYHEPYVGFPDAVVASTIEPLARALSNERIQVKGTTGELSRLNLKT